MPRATKNTHSLLLMVSCRLMVILIRARATLEIPAIIRAVVSDDAFPRRACSCLRRRCSRICDDPMSVSGGPCTDLRAPSNSKYSSITSGFFASPEWPLALATESTDLRPPAKETFRRVIVVGLDSSPCSSSVERYSRSFRSFLFA
uniref:Putative secreted protein n=1 Tax=Ixodes ricinus TaxID=34613 RepID=A0A6B0UUB9_IXORI